MQCAYNVGVGYDIGRELARFDVEDEDEDGHGAKDMVARLGQVVLDKAILSTPCKPVDRMGAVAGALPSAVPQVEHEVAHELDVAVLHVYRCTQSSYVLGDIVAEDDASHRRLPCTALAHEQHLALLLPLGRRVHLVVYAWAVQHGRVIRLLGGSIASVEHS